MVRVIVGIPTYEGHKQYIRGLLEALKAQTVPHEIIFCVTDNSKSLQDYLEQTGHTVIVSEKTEVRAERIENGRNAVRDAFLKTDATHLCWVDTDVYPQPDAFERLLLDDRDIVSGCYLSPFVHEGKTILGVVAYSFIPDPKLGQFVPVDALFSRAVLRVKAVGLGICMVKRNVVERIPFRRKGTGINTQDFLFCMDAENLGYATFLDTRVWTQHHGWDVGDERNNQLNIEYQGRRLGLLK